VRSIGAFKSPDQRRYNRAGMQQLRNGGEGCGWLSRGRWCLCREGTVKRAVADKALATMKDKVRDITKRTGGQSLGQVCKRLGEYLRGWKEYFRLADTPRVFGNLDKWIRRRLRALHLKHWGQQSTVYRELRARGMSEDAAHVVAVNCRRWRMHSASMMNVAFPIRYFDQLGIPRLATQPQLPEPPGADPHAGWCGRGP
jgi:hypothetical protein